MSVHHHALVRTRILHHNPANYRLVSAGHWEQRRCILRRRSAENQSEDALETDNRYETIAEVQEVQCSAANIIVLRSQASGVLTPTREVRPKSRPPGALLFAIIINLDDLFSGNAPRGSGAES